MSQGIPDTCRDHRCLTVCQKQQRKHEPAVEVDVPTLVEFHVRGIPDTCRDLRRLTSCQKQHRQNEPAGQVDIPTWVEVSDRGSWTHVGTTDVSLPVKNNTDRMNWLVR